MLCDSRGAPLALAIGGANDHDVTLFVETLLGVPVEMPDPTPETPQHLCLDAGYDAAWIKQAILDWEMVPHVRGRGEEKKALEQDPAKQARRWIVEVLHSWLNRFRRILIRWEKKPENYQAMLHLAFGAILVRLAHR